MRWPMWTGSNVPPKMPIRMLLLYRLAQLGGGTFRSHGRDEAAGAPLETGGTRCSRHDLEVPVVIRQLGRPQRGRVQEPVVRRRAEHAVETRHDSLHETGQ